MILIALGANLPFQGVSPMQTLRAALVALEHNGVIPVKVSAIYRTPAWPDPADPPFANMAAVVETFQQPEELLATLHLVEDAFGRERPRPNAPRSLDLDLLAYGDRVQKGPPALPHPGMAERGFVLTPLAEIAPDWRHPVLDKTVAEMLGALPESARRIAKLG